MVILHDHLSRYDFDVRFDHGEACVSRYCCEYFRQCRRRCDSTYLSDRFAVAIHQLFGSIRSQVLVQGIFLNRIARMCINSREDKAASSLFRVGEDHRGFHIQMHLFYTCISVPSRHIEHYDPNPAYTISTQSGHVMIMHVHWPESARAMSPSNASVILQGSYRTCEPSIDIEMPETVLTETAFSGYGLVQT